MTDYIAFDEFGDFHKVKKTHEIDLNKSVKFQFRLSAKQMEELKILAGLEGKKPSGYLKYLIDTQYAAYKKKPCIFL